MNIIDNGIIVSVKKLPKSMSHFERYKRAVVYNADHRSQECFLAAVDDANTIIGGATGWYDFDQLEVIDDSKQTRYDMILQMSRSSLL